MSDWILDENIIYTQVHNSAGPSPLNSSRLSSILLSVTNNYNYYAEQKKSDSGAKR